MYLPTAPGSPALLLHEGACFNNLRIAHFVAMPTHSLRSRMLYPDAAIY